MKDIEIWKYGKSDLAHQHLIMMDTILPDILEAIIPLDKFRRVSKYKNEVTCYECGVQHYITQGAATIITAEGKKYKIGKGDCLCINKGITCSWHILRKLKMRIREF